MKNIYFIEARSPGAHIFSRIVLPRLGSILLATILRDKGFNTKVFIEDIAIPSMNEFEDADAICISSITSTAIRAFELAKEFKAMGKTIVIGGPHSTFLPEESLMFADYVIRGEGEKTIVELMECLRDGLEISEIEGLSYIGKDGLPKRNPDREFIRDLDEAPVPDFNLVDKWERSRVVPIATSRGCPFNCEFCSVIHMFGRRYRFKSLNRVIKEIENLNAQGKHIFFVDDNFAANKERTKTLLREIVKRKIKIKWSGQTRTDIAKDLELVRLMKESGCFLVYIGFESINPATLALYNKRQNVEDINICIKTLKSHSINIHGMFVLGSDTDDIQTIRNTQKYAKKLGIESVQFMMLTPLPGTPVFAKMKSEGRLIHTNWSKYDAHHAVFEPNLMSAFELHVETLKAMAKFYSWRAALAHLLKFDLFYFFVMLYGKRSISKALGKKRYLYLNDLKKKIVATLDKKGVEGELSKRRKSIVGIVVNTTANLNNKESRFFKVFLRKLLGLYEPIVEGCSDASKCASVFNTKKDKFEFANVEAFSLFKICERIGLLLTIRQGKTRTAYNKAIKSIGGKEFKCDKVQLIYNSN